MKDHLVSFDDTETAFKSKSDSELNRAYWLFRLISFQWLVKISPPFLRASLVLHLPVKGLIRATIFKQFCGGETIIDCQRTIDELDKFHIGTILDYSVEGKDSEKDFDAVLAETLSTIKRAGGDAKIPFCVFKPTGIARFALLEKKNRKEKLSEKEAKEFLRFKERMDSICTSAANNNVPVLIDAEESWIQDAIDEIAREMMIKFNHEKIYIYNTLQMYRTGRVDYLKESVDHAIKNNYKSAFKIVRGAYMEKERRRAEMLSIISPVQPDKNSTDEDYNKAIKISIENILTNGLCAGTHNEESNLLLVEYMEEKKLAKNHPHIWFSQLYGMSDHISFNLAKKGYNVCKYVPYGPVEAVLPYLIRRAQENTSVAGQTGRELSLILEEKKRRRL